MSDNALVDAVVADTEDDDAFVRATLASIDALEAPEARPAPPRLLVTKISFDGTYPAGLGGAAFHYERTINTGVYLWKAPNLRGKSTVLRAIKWALTGTFASDARATQGWIGAVQLEFLLGDTSHRLRFTRGGPRQHDGAIERRDGDQWTEIRVFHNQGQHIGAVREFFSSAFGLDQLAWTQRIANSLETTEGHATWGTYFNGFFLDEQTYGDLVVPQLAPGAVNQKVFAALLGLPEVTRLNHIQIALDALNSRVEVARVVRGSHGGSEASLDKAKRELEKELENVRSRLDAQPKQTDLQAALRASDEAQDAFVKARRLLAEVREEVTLREASLHHAEARCRMLKDSVEFRLFFNGIEVTHCPRCERSVGDEEMKRELDRHLCRVCGHDVPREDDDEVEALRDELDHAEEERGAAQDGVAKSVRAEESAERAYAKAQDALREASRILDAATTGAAPLLARRDELNLELGKLAGRLESMKVATAEELERLRNIYEAARRHLLEQQDAGGAATLEAFQTTATELAHRFGLTDIESIRYDRERTLRIMQAGEERTYGAFSGGGQQRLKIAIFVALAVLSCSRPEVRHPRILIIDSPAGHEMVEKDVVSVASALRQLEAEHAADLQVLVASARDPLEEATVKGKREIHPGYLF